MYYSQMWSGGNKLKVTDLASSCCGDFSIIVCSKHITDNVFVVFMTHEHVVVFYYYVCNAI